MVTVIMTKITVFCLCNLISVLPLITYNKGACKHAVAVVSVESLVPSGGSIYTIKMCFYCVV